MAVRITQNENYFQAWVQKMATIKAYLFHLNPEADDYSNCPRMYQQGSIQKRIVYGLRGKFWARGH